METVDRDRLYLVYIMYKSSSQWCSNGFSYVGVLAYTHGCIAQEDSSLNHLVGQSHQVIHILSSENDTHVVDGGRRHQASAFGFGPCARRTSADGVYLHGNINPLRIHFISNLSGCIRFFCEYARTAALMLRTGYVPIPSAVRLVVSGCVRSARRNAAGGRYSCYFIWRWHAVENRMYRQLSDGDCTALCDVFLLLVQNHPFKASGTSIP